MIRVGDAERYRRLIRGRPAADVQNHPDIRKLKIPRRVAVASAQNASTEDLLVVVKRPVDVCYGKKMRDADSLPRRHLVALPSVLYAVHGRLQLRPSHEFQKRLSCGSRRRRILTSTKTAVSDGKRLPVRLLLEDGAEPQQFVFDQEWNNLRELHLFFLTVSEAGYMLSL